MLKMTRVKLEKIDNIDVHLFLEKGMRGGVSYTSNRYSKSSDDKTLMYWDMNNLYRTVLSFDYFPYGDYLDMVITMIIFCDLKKLKSVMKC